MKLPSEAQARKATPVYSGVLKYFPLAIAAVARVSYVGNEQHNPGLPLHWAREKSTDQMDAAIRHVLEYAMGNELDEDGQPHLAKAMWRIAAQLQLDEERAERKEKIEDVVSQAPDWRDGTVWGASDR